jgi:hypothetical protein
MWEDDTILYLDVTAFIAGGRVNFVAFNPLTKRTQQQTELKTIMSRNPIPLRTTFVDQYTGDQDACPGTT